MIENRFTNNWLCVEGLQRDSRKDQRGASLHPTELRVRNTCKMRSCVSVVVFLLVVLVDGIVRVSDKRGQLIHNDRQHAWACTGQAHRSNHRIESDSIREITRGPLRLLER